MAWPETLLDGVIGAIIGTGGAFGAAYLLIREQRKSDKAQREADMEQAREERRLQLTSQLLNQLTEMQAEVYNQTGDPNDQVGHMKALDFINRRWFFVQVLAMQLGDEALAAAAKKLGGKSFRDGSEVLLS